MTRRYYEQCTSLWRLWTPRFRLLEVARCGSFPRPVEPNLCSFQIGGLDQDLHANDRSDVNGGLTLEVAAASCTGDTGIDGAPKVGVVGLPPDQVTHPLPAWSCICAAAALMNRQVCATFTLV